MKIVSPTRGGLVQKAIIILVVFVVVGLGLCCQPAHGFLVEGHHEQVHHDHDHRQMQGFNVNVFACDGNNQEINVVTPLTSGTTLRLCFEPNRPTLLQNIYILKIESFQLEKPNANFGQSGNTFPRQIIQDPVANGINGDNGSTILQCTPGATVCTMVITLEDGFFHTGDGTVTGRGQVALQKGNSGRRELSATPTTTTATINLSFQNPRSLQSSSSSSSSSSSATPVSSYPGFSGWAGVSYLFTVKDAGPINNPPPKNTALAATAQSTGRLKRLWKNSPGYIQFLFVLAIFVIILICCWLCGGVIFWRHLCGCDNPHAGKRGDDEDDRDDYEDYDDVERGGTTTIKVEIDGRPKKDRQPEDTERSPTDLEEEEMYDDQQWDEDDDEYDEQQHPPPPPPHVPALTNGGVGDNKSYLPTAYSSSRALVVRNSKEGDESSTAASTSASSKASRRSQQSSASSKASSSQQSHASSKSIGSTSSRRSTASSKTSPSIQSSTSSLPSATSPRSSPSSKRSSTSSLAGSSAKPGSMNSMPSLQTIDSGNMTGDTPQSPRSSSYSSRSSSRPSIH